MALADDVQNRYGGSTSQLLVELTNPRAADATTIDTTLLGRACTAVSDGWFPTYVQIAYDSTDQRHVEVACLGVLSCLKGWAAASPEAARSARDEWIEKDAKPLRAVTSRARIAPQTTSRLTPTPQSAGAVRPATDFAAFDSLVPGSTSSDSTPSDTA